MTHSGDSVAPRSGTARLGYQPESVRVRRILLFAAGIVSAVIIASIVVHLLILALMATERYPEGPTPVQTAPPEPRLQADPLADYRVYIQQEREQLNSYGWVDREAGIVHIPIDRAMQLMLEPEAEQGQGQPAAPEGGTP